MGDNPPPFCNEVLRKTMKILLAPMEGVVDWYMRDLLTRIGGYDACVTEFVRVVDKCLPEKAYRRLCPELGTAAKTAAGTPVVVQLLGGEAAVMAENAALAAALGAAGIDLNFGCPSKVVNRNGGGAVLLKEPERIQQIVAAVRTAVPAPVPVTAKIRLGFDHADDALAIARAVERAGASAIVVHARTRADGYKAPARWQMLRPIREALTIPVIANGDINSVEDYRRCLAISGCDDVMIGRGAVGCPDLARQIRRYQGGQPCQPLAWAEVAPLVVGLAQQMNRTIEDKLVLGRIKQWLVMLKKVYPQAQRCFDQGRRLPTLAQMTALLGQHE